MNQVGRAVLRMEDDKLLKGRGIFTDDLNRPGMVHLAFVRSPHAHARIRAIRTERAAAVPGVRAVFTGRDLAALCKPIYVDVIFPRYKAPSRPVVAIESVKFVGDAVAVVVADSRYVGEDAADLVDVDYEPLPVVVDLEDALRPAAPLVHPELGDNVFFTGEFATDGLDTVFASADLVLRERFQSTRVAGGPRPRSRTCCGRRSRTWSTSPE
jgi:carbon-monoxide dehydrogenase large subunit